MGGNGVGGLACSQGGSGMLQGAEMLCPSPALPSPGWRAARAPGFAAANETKSGLIPPIHLVGSGSLLPPPRQLGWGQDGEVGGCLLPPHPATGPPARPPQLWGCTRAPRPCHPPSRVMGGWSGPCHRGACVQAGWHICVPPPSPSPLLAAVTPPVRCPCLGLAAR